MEVHGRQIDRQLVRDVLQPQPPGQKLGHRGLAGRQPGRLGDKPGAQPPCLLEAEDQRHHHGIAGPERQRAEIRQDDQPPVVLRKVLADHGGRVVAAALAQAVVGRADGLHVVGLADGMAQPVAGRGRKALRQAPRGAVRKADAPAHVQQHQPEVQLVHRPHQPGHGIILVGVSVHRGNPRRQPKLGVDGGHQQVVIHRLDQVVVRPRALSRQDVRAVRKSRQKDEGHVVQVRPRLAHPAQEGHAVDARQGDVRQDQVGANAVQPDQGRLGAGLGQDLVSCLGQHRGKVVQQIALVLADKDDGALLLVRFLGGGTLRRRHGAPLPGGRASRRDRGRRARPWSPHPPPEASGRSASRFARRW